LRVFSARVIEHRDALLALALALVVFCSARFGPQPTSIPDAAGLAVLCTPLVWRGRWPLVVLAAVAGGVVVYLTVAPLSNAIVAPLVVAVYSYTVSATGSRQRTITIGAT
jgi:hypothetical protein